MVRRHFFRRTAAIAMGFALFVAGTAPASAATTLAGGGSSFAGIEMDQWTDDVQSIVPPVEISYTPSSSGNGRTFFRAGTYPFAVSDIPYQGSEAGGDVAPSWAFDYIPITAGGLGFMYNVPGVSTLKLNAAVACGIFTGEITSWNDPAIVALNPGVTLPNQGIIPVLRGDNSGTTWVLEDWCITEAPTVWSSFVSYVNAHGDNVTPPVTATGPSSQFPAIGSAQTAQGDSGTAAVVGSSTGTYAITYVEPEYAREYGNKPVAYVENASGDYVQPTPENVAGALSYATAEQIPGIQQLNFNGAGCNVYNPATYSYLLARTDGSYGTGYGQTVGGFLNYVLTIGEKEASSIDYASIGLSLEQYGIQKAQDIPGYPALSANEQANFAAGDVTPSIVQSTPCGAAFQLTAPATTTTVATTTTTVAPTTTTVAPTTTTAATTTTTAQTTGTTAHSTTATTVHTTTTTARTTATTGRTTATTGRTTATTGRTTATTARTTATTGRTTATTGRTTLTTARTTPTSSSPPTTQRTSGGRPTGPSTPTTAARNTPGLVTPTTAPGPRADGATTPTLTAAPGGPRAGTPTTQPSTLGSHSSPGTTANVGGGPLTGAATTVAGTPATSPVGSATTAPGTPVTSTPGVSTAGASATTAPGASATTAPGASSPAVSPTVSLTNTGPDAQTGGQQVFLVIAGLSIAGVSEAARRRLRKAR